MLACWRNCILSYLPRVRHSKWCSTLQRLCEAWQEEFAVHVCWSVSPMRCRKTSHIDWGWMWKWVRNTAEYGEGPSKLGLPPWATSIWSQSRQGLTGRPFAPEAPNSVVDRMPAATKFRRATVVRYILAWAVGWGTEMLGKQADLDLEVYKSEWYRQHGTTAFHLHLDGGGKPSLWHASSDHWWV